MDLHHLHLRKRLHQDGHKSLRQRLASLRHPFPHPHWQIRLLDEIILAIAVLGPLMSFSQVIQIYTTQQVAGISPIAYGSSMLFNIPWIIYGIVHRDMRITVCYILWFIINSSVFVGIFLYS